MRTERPQGRAAPSPPPEGVESSWGGPAMTRERPQGRAAPSPTALGARGALLLAVLWAMPLPLASNRIWAQGAWLALLAALAVWELWADRRLAASGWSLGVPPGMRVYMGCMALWVLYLAWQLLPLPPGLVALARSAAAPSLPAASGFVPLTIDRYATLAYLAKAVMLLLLQWLLLRRFDNRPRLEKLIWAWLAIGGIEAVAGVVLYATASTYRVFFVTVEQGIRASGTFVYHNQFAGYMEMMLALGIGWLIALLGRDPSVDRRRGAVSWLFAGLRFLASSKAPLRALLIVLVVALIGSRSRMGNAAFFAALWLVGGATIVALRRSGAAGRRASRTVAVLMLSILLLDVVVIGRVVGIDKVMRRIEDTHLSNRVAAGGDPSAHREQSIDQRIAPGLSALGMLRDHPWFGTGGGTFFLGFMPYRPQKIVGYYDHAHDDYVEFLVESGIVGILPLFVMLFWSQWRGWFQLLGRNTGAFERGVAFASVMGVVELLIHSTVDFNLQNPTNAALFLWLLALPHWLDARRLRHRRSDVKSGGAPDEAILQ